MLATIISRNFIVIFISKSTTFHHRAISKSASSHASIFNCFENIYRISSNFIVCFAKSPFWCFIFLYKSIILFASASFSERWFISFSYSIPSSLNWLHSYNKCLFCFIICETSSCLRLINFFSFMQVILNLFSSHFIAIRSFYCYW